MSPAFLCRAATMDAARAWLGAWGKGGLQRADRCQRHGELFHIIGSSCVSAAMRHQGSRTGYLAKSSLTMGGIMSLIVTERPLSKLTGASSRRPRPLGAPRSFVARDQHWAFGVQSRTAPWNL